MQPLRFRGIFILILFLPPFIVFLPLCCHSPEDETVPDDWLTVRNGRIVRKESGQEIVLRGINLDMFFYYEPWAPEIVWNYIDEWAIDELANAGVNHVRLCFHWQTLAHKGPEISLKTEAISLFEDIIGWCAQRKIYVLLDMHVAPGDSEIDPIERGFWSDPQNIDDFIALWQLLAVQWRDEPFVVGYDLFNEPAPPLAEDWWELVEQAVSAIRGIDERHCIFVEPPMIVDDYSFRLINDDQIVYSFHFYEPFQVSHRNAGWVADTEMPGDAIYPGEVLSGLEWVGNVEPAAMLTGPSDWTEITVTIESVPENMDYVGIGLYAWFGPLDVSFDRIRLTHNEEIFDVVNPDILEESLLRPENPRAWFHYGEGDYSYVWLRNSGFDDNFSLAVRGEGSWALWHQIEWDTLTQPLVRVKTGDTVTATACVRAEILEGYAGISLNLYQANYTEYNYNVLRELVYRDAITWLEENNVPGHVGEFGSMALSEDPSASALITDMTLIWNEFDLPWTLWSYRDDAGADSRGFGLLQCPVTDVPEECQTYRPSIAQPFFNALPP